MILRPRSELAKSEMAATCAGLISSLPGTLGSAESSPWLARSLRIRPSTYLMPASDRKNPSAVTISAGVSTLPMTCAEPAVNSA